LALPAAADIRILSSGGGTVGSYLNFFQQVKQSGERVVIDGPCLSACTLVLSKIPRKRICVTSRAVLGFHAPYIVDKNGHTYRKREVTQAIDATPGRGAGLDQATWRLEPKGHHAQGPRAHSPLSTLLIPEPTHAYSN
jgi:hypothetical protein